MMLPLVMATRCFSLPRARVFGVGVERVDVDILTRSRSLSLSKARPVVAPHTSHSARSLATAKSRSPPKLRKSSSPLVAVQVLAQELEIAASVVKSDAVLSEVAVQRALSTCEGLARRFVEPIESPETSFSREKTPTSKLLSLDEQSRLPITPSSTEKRLSRRPIEPHVADKISSTAYSIVTDPKVFITPPLLATYLHTQSVLGCPKSFPQIFDLYASKPIPQPGRLPITYKDPDLNRVSSAVPLGLAHSALTAAIEAKDLPLCLSIIDTSVCTTAFKRSKVLRHALLPFSGLALAPAAAYVLAAQLAQYQHSMDHQMATNMAFVGILAYVGFTATLGLIAIATENDQMDRVTWAIGTPLRERWVREDERALVDRVAAAWGFQDEYKRGEEEGEEWEALREWILMRGMVLDKPELMEGME